MLIIYFQFIIGFVSFLYPEIAIEYKKAVMIYHVFFGVLTFVLSVVTTLLGFSEKILFALYVLIIRSMKRFDLIVCFFLFLYIQETLPARYFTDGRSILKYTSLNINFLRRASCVHGNKTKV